MLRPNRSLSHGARDHARAPFLHPGLAAVALPALVAAILYLPSLRNGFAFDDVPIIVANPVAHGLGSFPAQLTGPYWGQYGQLYRPVTITSLAMDWTLGGGAPWVFHLVNLLLHAGVTALVAVLALRWLGAAGAAAAGFIFAVHPVHAEAVANIVGRSELLCAAALCGVAIVAARRPVRHAGGWLILAALSALAIGSKETGALAPIIAWAAVGLSPSDDGSAMRRRWTAAAASGIGVVLMLVVRLMVLGALTGDRPHPAWSVATTGERVVHALSSAARAAGLLLAPQQPAIDYSPTLDALAMPQWPLVIAGALLVALAVVALVMHVRRPRLVTFALIFAAATWLPVSNLLFPSGLVIAERTLYSPSVGLALLFGAAVAAATALRPRARVIAALAVVIWSAPAIWITAREIPVWRDSETVYGRMVRRAPASYKAHFLVGNLRVDAGRSDEAMRLYERGLALFDGDPQLLYAGAVHALHRGDTARALSWLERAVALEPANRRARTSLARALAGGGDTARAAALLAEGLRREPDQIEWRRTLDAWGRRPAPTER